MPPKTKLKVVIKGRGKAAPQAANSAFDAADKDYSLAVAVGGSSSHPSANSATDASDTNTSSLPQVHVSRAASLRGKVFAALCIALVGGYVALSGVNASGRVGVAGGGERLRTGHRRDGSSQSQHGADTASIADHSSSTRLVLSNSINASGLTIGMAGVAAEEEASIAEALACYRKGRVKGVNYYYIPPSSLGAPAMRGGECVPLPRSITAAPSSTPLVAAAAGTSAAPYHSPPDVTAMTTLEGIDRMDQHQQHTQMVRRAASHSGMLGEGVGVGVGGGIAVASSPSVHSRWLFNDWRLWEGELGCGGADGGGGEAVAATAALPSASHQPQPSSSFVTLGAHRPTNLNHMYQIDNVCVDEEDGSLVTFEEGAYNGGMGASSAPASSSSPLPPRARSSVARPDGRTEHMNGLLFEPNSRMFHPLNSNNGGGGGGGHVEEEEEEQQAMMGMGGSSPIPLVIPQSIAGGLTEHDAFEAVVKASLEHRYYGSGATTADANATTEALPLPRFDLLFPKGPALIFPINSGQEVNPCHVFHRIATAAATKSLLRVTSMLFTMEAAATSDHPEVCSLAQCSQMYDNGGGGGSGLIAPPQQQQYGEGKGAHVVASLIGGGEGGFRVLPPLPHDMATLLCLPFYLRTSAEAAALATYFGGPSRVAMAKEAYTRMPRLADLAKALEEEEEELAKRTKGADSKKNSDRIELLWRLALRGGGAHASPSTSTIPRELFTAEAVNTARTAAEGDVPLPSTGMPFYELAALEAAEKLVMRRDSTRTLYGQLLSTGADGCEAHRCSADFKCSAEALAAHRRCATPYASVAVSLPKAFPMNLDKALLASGGVGGIASAKARSLLGRFIAERVSRRRKAAPSAPAADTLPMLTTAAPARSAAVVDYIPDTLGYTRRAWHGAVRAVLLEGQRIRRDVLRLRRRQTDTDGVTADFPPALAAIIAQGGAEGLTFNLSSSSPHHYIAQWRGRIVACLVHWGRCSEEMRRVDSGSAVAAATTAAAPTAAVGGEEEGGGLSPVADPTMPPQPATSTSGAGSSGSSSESPLPSSPLDVFTPYFKELFAVLVERLEATEKMKRRGAAVGGGAAVPPPPRRLICYKRAYVAQVRHFATMGGPKAFDYSYKGMFNALASANCNTREVLNISYRAAWQRYGPCAGSGGGSLGVGGANAPATGAGTTSTTAGESVDEGERDGPLTTASLTLDGEGQPPPAAEPSRDTNRDAHPLLALPPLEQRAMARRFEASRAQIEAILKEGAAQIAAMEGEILQRAGAGTAAAPHHLSPLMMKVDWADYFNGAGLDTRPNVSSHARLATVVGDLVARIDAAQSSYDGVLMQYFTRQVGRRTINTAVAKRSSGEEGGVASDSAAHTPHIPWASRPIRVYQLHRSAKRAFGLFRPMFSKLMADREPTPAHVHDDEVNSPTAASLHSLRSYFDFEFIEGFDSEAYSLSSTASAPTPGGPAKGAGGDAGGTTPLTATHSLNTPRARQQGALMGADIAMGTHGADLFSFTFLKPSAFTLELSTGGMDGGSRLNGGYFAPHAFARNIGYLRVYTHRVVTSPDPIAEQGIPLNPFGAFGGQIVVSLPDLRQTYSLAVCGWLATNAVRLDDEAKAKAAGNSTAHAVQRDHSYLVPWWCRGGASAIVRQLFRAATMQRGATQHRGGEGQHDTNDHAITPTNAFKSAARHALGAAAVLSPSYFTVRTIPSRYGFGELYCPVLAGEVVAGSSNNATVAFAPRRVAYADLVRMQSECAKGVTLGTHGAAVYFRKKKQKSTVQEGQRYVESRRLKAEGLQTLLESAYIGRGVALPSHAAQFASRLVVEGLWQLEEVLRDSSALMAGQADGDHHWGSGDRFLLGAVRPTAATAGGSPSLEGTSSAPPSHALCGEGPIPLGTDIFYEYGGKDKKQGPSRYCLRALLSAATDPVLGGIIAAGGGGAGGDEASRRFADYAKQHASVSPLLLWGFAEVLARVSIAGVAAGAPLGSPCPFGITNSQTRAALVDWVEAQFFRVSGRPTWAKRAPYLDTDEYAYGSTCTRWMPPGGR